MKLLVIDDDEGKRNRMLAVLQQSFKTARIDTATSMTSGLEQVKTLQPDCLILDISLTTFEVSKVESGGRGQPQGGIWILRQIERLDLNLPVIVVTQFGKFWRRNREITVDDLAQELYGEFPALCRKVIHYESKFRNWTSLLEAAVTECLAEKGAK